MAAWKGLALERFVIYELHTGTFSPEGTFAGIIPWLDALKDLGVTVLGIMPVAQFPGARNGGITGCILSRRSSPMAARRNPSA